MDGIFAAFESAVGLLPFSTASQSSLAANRANIPSMLLKTLSRLLLCLLPLIVLLCAVIPVIAARDLGENTAWRVFGFDYCSLPCFAGITSGKTPFDDASTLLVRNVEAVDPRMINSGTSINFWARDSTQQLGGLVRNDRAQVGELRLMVILPVEEVISELGAPDCILPNTTGSPDRMTIIFWERSGISTAAVLGTDAQNRALNLSANTLAIWLSAMEPNPCALRGAQAWKGFAPLWGYTREPEN